MAFIQAAIDDSASEKGDQRLFLAGYVNRAETWALFADAWQDELRRSQPIQYLRMTEAASRRGQFTGWSKTDRDEKLRGLMRVARHFKPLSFHCSVSRAEYWRTVTPVAPRGLGPHFVCCFGMVSQLAKYTAQIDPKARIEFIFDKTDGLEDDIDLFFDYMARNLPRDARKTISSRPIFRDDKAFTPLQAADTLAWHLRRSHEDAGSWQAKNSGLCNPSGHLHADVDALLPRWSHAFSKMPATLQMQRKSDWRNLKLSIRRATAAGFIPPHGTRLRNLFHALRETVREIINR